MRNKYGWKIINKRKKRKPNENKQFSSLLRFFSVISQNAFLSDVTFAWNLLTSTRMSWTFYVILFVKNRDDALSTENGRNDENRYLPKALVCERQWETKLFLLELPVEISSNRQVEHNNVASDDGGKQTEEITRKFALSCLFGIFFFPLKLEEKALTLSCHCCRNKDENKMKIKYSTSTLEPASYPMLPNEYLHTQQQQNLAQRWKFLVEKK